MSNHFAFIDESGNPTQERFFGLGLLMIDDEIGDLYDSLKSFYDKAKDLARDNKLARIERLKQEKELEQIASIASSGKRFELKFKYVNNTNNSVYSGLISKYFTFKSARFCALVIDKQKKTDNKSWRLAINPWETYIQEAAMLVANNIKHVSPCEICILADDLTRPSNIKKSFERSLQDATAFRIKKLSLPDKIFGATRLESHASLMLQAVDILLGAVMYDYKKKAGLISSKLAVKQDPVVKKIHDILGTKTLIGSKTYSHPSYFSVWEFKG